MSHTKNEKQNHHFFWIHHDKYMNISARMPSFGLVIREIGLEM